MANRFETPNPQFSDPTGLPYAGGSLTFFASGTTTPLSTFQDRALSIANTNPVVLDSAGRAGNVFLQNLAYKVILEDANNNVIWTADPVYASDFSTVAQFQSGNGSPNGSVAGSAGSATIPASSYWDATNLILYVCTQTGNAASAVWTAVNSASAAAIVPAPQGYLTPTSATPIIPSDVVAATNVFYTPYQGNLIPIYNGTTFVPTVFSEIGIALTASNNLASTIYDIFVFNNAGVLTLVNGPAWSNSAAGAGSRGTGAGTTQLTRISGILVNAVSMTVKNGASSFTVPANQATYVGSILIDGTPGQVTLHRGIGQNRKWGIWNAFNRVPIVLQMADPTANWNTAPASFRSSNGSSSNTIFGFTGLPEEEMQATFTQTIQQTSTSGVGCEAVIGIGINSTSVTTGLAGTLELSLAAGTLVGILSARASATLAPTIGLNNFNSLEEALSGTTANVFFGQTSNMQLALTYRG